MRIADDLFLRTGGAQPDPDTLHPAIARKAADQDGEGVGDAPGARDGITDGGKGPCLSLTPLRALSVVALQASQTGDADPYHEQDEEGQDVLRIGDLEGEARGHEDGVVGQERRERTP